MSSVSYGDGVIYTDSEQERDLDAKADELDAAGTPNRRLSSPGQGTDAVEVLGAFNLVLGTWYSADDFPIFYVRTRR
jgi:hypothetical protein